MLYIRSPELIHLLAECLYSLTIISQFPPSPIPWQSLIYSVICSIIELRIGSHVYAYLYWSPTWKYSCFLFLSFFLFFSSFFSFSFTTFCQIYYNLSLCFSFFLPFNLLIFQGHVTLCVFPVYSISQFFFLFFQSALCPLMCKINACSCIVLIDIFGFLTVSCLPCFS